METGNYRRWVPAIIIGLILCLPVIAWLFGGTSEHHPPASPASDSADSGQ